jgi:hypothetical protein
MSFRLPDLFKVLLSDFPRRESNIPYLDCISEIAEVFPLISSGCIEYYLGKGEGRMDLNVNIGYEMNEHKLKLDMERLEELIVDDDLKKSFKPIINFLQEWKKDDFRLSPFIDFVWLVFDIVNPSKKEIHPWFYVMFHSNILTSDPQIKVELIKKTLEELDSMPMNWSDIEKIYYSFPPSTTIRSVGIKPVNEGNSIRTYIYGEQIEDIFTLLETNHWMGDINDLKKAILPFSEISYKYALSIDVGFTLSPKIGIELYPREKHNADMLSLLKERGLCNEHSLEDCLAWQGSVKIQVNDSDHQWPDDYKKEAIRSDGNVEIARLVPLVKIVYQQDIPLSAKLYLYYNANDKTFQHENVTN